LDEFNALENIMIPALIDRQPRIKWKRALELLEQMELADERTTNLHNYQEVNNKGLPWQGR
jgi:ABC-type lipoprotein export system ATPase subunit